MLNIDDVRSSTSQNVHDCILMVVGALFVAFSRNDVLPNTTLSYITFMNTMTEIGLGMMVVAVVGLLNVDDDILHETFAWKLCKSDRGAMWILFGLNALAFLIACVIAVTVTA